MNFILGTKQKMTQLWQGDKIVAVTKVQAGPCVVSAIKTVDNDGYNAVQLAFATRKAKNIRKPQLVQFKKLGITPRYLKEFRLETLPEGLKLGDRISVSTFTVGDQIQVTGTSKGRGFQGVVKRHKFSGAKATHGTKDQLRMPGSIGATGPAHVFKGMRMPGRMGTDRVTTTGLEVIEVDEANNILYIKGALPGATNGLIMVQGVGELKIVADKPKTEPEAEKTPEMKAEVETEETGKEEVVVESKEEQPIKEDKVPEESKIEEEPTTEKKEEAKQ